MPSIKSSKGKCTRKRHKTDRWGGIAGLNKMKDKDSLHIQ